MSSVKVEAAAINAVRNLINLSNSMTSDEIKEGEKGVSFDGCIPIYLKNSVKKENFCNKIDIQVKGRSDIKFSMDLSDIHNYKNVGGTIIFYVQVNNDRSQTRMYVKSLLPYEINQMLKKNNNSNKKISLSFEYIALEDVEKLEDICFQFQSDKDKQYSYKNEYKTIEDFEKEKGTFSLGLNISSISINPIDYLKKKSFIYFQPEKYNTVQIPCGIAELTSIAFKHNMDIKIGEEIINTTVEVKQFSDYIIVNINDCIIYNSKINMFTFKLNSNLEKVLYNIELIRKFVKYQTIIIGDGKLAIKSGGNYSILEHQIEVINKLNKIVKELDIVVDPIIDFQNIESIKNIELVYNNLIDKKGIPFKNEYDVFLLKINIFNITISFSVQKRKDKTYDLYNLYDLLINEKDLFSYLNKENELVIIYPNFSIFNKNSKFSVTYLIADNIVNKLNYLDISEDKVLGNLDLEANLTWFILDSLEYYDINKDDFCCNLLLAFLERVSKCLLKTRNKTRKHIYYINYCQILKRLNKLNHKELKQLLSIKNKTKDQMIKACVSILLGAESEFEIYYESLNDEQQKLLKSYPIFNLLKNKLLV